MSEWKEYKLGDVVRSNTESINKNYPNETILYLDTGSITRGKIDKFQEYKLHEAPSRAKRLVKNNDIIYSTVRPIQRHYGFVVNPPKNLVVSTGFSVIETNKHFADPMFIYNFLTSDEIVETLDVIADASTSAYPSLKPSDIEDLDILLPPLAEQRAIASVLSSLDDKIDLLHRQNKTLEAMAETLYRQLFAEGADDGWEETTIENVCVKVASGGTPSTKVGEYYNGDINWYSTRELNDTFLYESSTKITNSGLENSSAKMFPENTVLIAIYAAPTVGRLGILANDATFNQAACGFIVDENKICFEYLYLHLLFSRQKLNDIASGSAQQNLNVKIMRNFEILLLPANIIHKFKYVVRPIFRQIKLNTKQIMTLEKLRDTLLPKLISGEVKVEYEDN